MTGGAKDAAASGVTMRGGAVAFAVATRPIHASTASAAVTEAIRARMDVHGDARRRATKFDGFGELMG